MILCNKRSNTALFSFLKQSFTKVNSLISKILKALSLSFSYQRLNSDVIFILDLKNRYEK